MTICKRLAFSVVAVLLLSLPMFGQYTATQTFALEDNAANCTSSNNCFVSLGGAADEVKAGADGNQISTTGFTPSSTYGSITVLAGQNLTGGDTNATIALVGTAGGLNLTETTGANWMRIGSGVTSVTGMLFSHMIALSNNVSYHLNLLVPTVTQTVSGFWACPANGCPTGSYHTITAVAAFEGNGGLHGTGGVTAQNSAYPETQMQAVAKEWGTGCDPIFGDPSDPNCNPNINGAANCPVMGPLQQFGAPGGGPSRVKIIAGGWANTGAIYVPGSAHVVTANNANKGLVACPSNNSCSAATTVPYCSVPGIVTPPDIGETPDEECKFGTGIANFVVGQAYVEFQYLSGGSTVYACAGENPATAPYLKKSMAAVIPGFSSLNFPAGVGNFPCSGPQ
jgi:hypothetical protein